MYILFLTTATRSVAFWHEFQVLRLRYPGIFLDKNFPKTFPGKFLGFLGFVHVKPRKFQKDLMKFQKNLMGSKPKKFLGFSRVFLGFFSVSRFLGCPKNSQKLSKIFKNFHKFSKILQNSQKFSKILQNSSENHLSNPK